MARLELSVLSLALGVTMLATPALALSTKDCSVKYQAAKQAGTLNGQKWNDFRKAECGAPPDKATSPAANPFSPTAATPTAPAPTPATTATRTAPAPAPRSTATGPAVFPRAVDPKYASESAGKGRMHTCLDQYKANKATAGGAGNGGMNWIEKGGGYYSACNKGLKS
ncbi:hypothetical protein MKK68_12975 [Methylobacterium sp. E-016]|uniref:hypothetical protein n=1 Tax=Methylobacterium sp. E-016 TaxID=2836556 RepID=UPI001FBB0BD3|nr:hypothetical protein [Methylobacterium sp. E-016]MCJ2076557.1 hypothetical protein [Methylobacterium sp. E-016]